MKIEFDTKNAAYTEEGITYTRAGEILGILQKVADRVARGETEGVIRDIDGNTVGSWAL